MKCKVESYQLARKIHFKNIYFYDFDMVLLWFCYDFDMVFYVFFSWAEKSYDFDMVFLWPWDAPIFRYENCYGCLLFS